MKSLRFLLVVVFISVLLVPGALASETKPLTKPPKGGEWKSLFNGKDLDGWHLKERPSKSSIMSWTALNGVLVNIPPSEEDKHGIDLVSDLSLGSHELYIEFMVPERCNSGVYVIGQYEIQVFDSYGSERLRRGDCGAIYGKIAPSENASLPPGHWQSFHAIFHKAEVGNGRAVKNPRITVYHNGKKIIDNAELEGVTGAALKNRVVEEGPTYLQGNHGMVFYRNIYYKPIRE